MKQPWLIAVTLISFSFSHLVTAADPRNPPGIGAKIIDTTLLDLKGSNVKLSEVANGRLVIVVLRGYPGYQCPICTLQVGDILSKAKEFAAKKATVVLIYPGPAMNLDQHAREFVRSKKFPENFRFLLDPDFVFTNAWGLRWEVPKETAYPSSFVVNQDGEIVFANVSKSHGGRTKATELLDVIPK